MRLGDLDALSAFVGDLRSTLHKEQSTFKAMTQSEFEIKDNMLLNFQHAIDNAPPVSIKSCHECPFVADEEKHITNGDAWKSYCEGQEVGFKKAEDVFERMKLIQETVNCIRNTFKLDTESDKLVRNCMALVQNAIDGEYHDMEEVDVSEIERTQGKCEKCDFRKFSEQFIDGVVDVMTKNGITSVEQLSKLLKGSAE